MRYTNLKSSVIDTINDSINMLYSKKIAEFELSVRTSNCLRNDNIITIGDLVRKTESEMLRTPNFGRKSLNEIKELHENNSKGKDIYSYWRTQYNEYKGVSNEQ